MLGAMGSGGVAVLVRYWKSYALKRSMRRVEKRRADVIDLGDPANNVFTLRLSDDAGTWNFNFHKLTERAAEGLAFNDNLSTGCRYCVLPRVFPDAQVLIEHHYRGYTISYTSPTKFLILDSIHYPWIMRQFNRIAQALFNQRRLARKDRITVLRLFANKALEKKRPKLSVYSVMNEVYGMRWVFHPRNSALESYYQLILESLAHTGDLKENGHAFEITPKAFATLAQYEEENRRHKDIHNAQILLVILTGALAITSLGQLLR
ncbi:MAG: hypothetical protein WD341_15895 [Tistlia sp.]|uniref:hypothetical protein n=1 Tax=Tistlia sp. TaxID=3057121 RepID=UPI0034A51007